MVKDAIQPMYDAEIRDIVRYVFHYKVDNEQTLDLVRTSLLDTLGCAAQAMAESRSARLLIQHMVGPASQVSNGCRLPGSSFVLDPIRGALCFGILIRFLDHNDCLIGAEWGHPSDNIGAILPIMDWLSQRPESAQSSHRGPRMTIHTLLEAIVKAYEIQGVMQQKNAFNQRGLDHTILVKLASSAVVPWLMGLSEEQAMACISHAWMDSAPLRIYRQGSNTIERKGWAAGDACARAVQFALMVHAGQQGAPTVLSMPKWGFYDTVWRSNDRFLVDSPYSDWACRNVFFKIMPVEGHGIAGVEAALALRGAILDAGEGNVVDSISAIHVRTNAAAKLIIDKAFVPQNPADRDHSMQFVVAVSLLKGSPPDIQDYADTSPFASSKDVAALIERTEVLVDDGLTSDYMNPSKRSLSVGIAVTLTSGAVVGEHLIEYPLGHISRPDTPRRVLDKYKANMAALYSAAEIQALEQLVVQKGDGPVSGMMEILARRVEQSPLQAHM